MKYLASLYPENPSRIGQCYYANSRFNAQTNKVLKVVGNPSVIADFEKVLGRVELEDNPGRFIDFQVCLSAKSKPGSIEDLKPNSFVNAKTWGSEFSRETTEDPKKKQLWEGLTWHTVHAPISTVKALIEDQFVLRYGIKTGGNDKKNFKGGWGLAFDLDSDPSIDWQQTLQIATERFISPGVIHYSPTGNPDNNNLRLIIFFDEFIESYEKLSNLARSINDLFPNAAKNVHDPGRLFYPTINDSVLYFDAHSVNDFGLLTETYPYIPLQTESTIDENHSGTLDETERTTKNKRFLDHLIKHKFNGDYEAVFDEIPLWCEKFGFTLENWHEHSSPGDNLKQYRGTDPIFPEESRTGSSFSVGLAADYTIWYKSDRTGVYGDLPDLWYRLDATFWEVQRSNQNYFNAMREICAYYEIPDITVSFEREQTEGIKLGVFNSSLMDCLDPKALEDGKLLLLPHLVWEFFVERHRDKFLFEACSKKYWLYSETDQLWLEYSPEHFRAYLRSFLESFEKIQNVPIYRLLTAPFLKGLESCKSYLKGDLICEVFTESIDYIFCANGAYNLETKELEEYSAKIKNRYKLPWKFQPSTGIGIEAVKNYLEFIVIPEQRDCVSEVLDWVSMAVQAKGYLTRFALGFVGSPGAGKTGLANVLTLLLTPENTGDKKIKSPVKTIDADLLLSENSNFTTTQLDGVLLGVLEEFSGLPFRSKGNRLKTLIANPTTDKRGFLIPAEKKRGDHYDFYSRIALITTSQDFPKFPPNDGGFKRRFLFVQVQKRTEKNVEVFDALKSPEVLQDLFSWCLEQDSKEVLSRFHSLSSSIAGSDASVREHWAFKNATLMQMSNNKYYSFVADQLTVDSSTNLSATNLFNLYKSWCTDVNETPGTLKAFGKDILSAIADVLGLKKDEIKIRKTSGIYYQGIKPIQVGEGDEEVS